MISKSRVSIPLAVAAVSILLAGSLAGWIVRDSWAEKDRLIAQAEQGFERMRRAHDLLNRVSAAKGTVLRDFGRTQSHAARLLGEGNPLSRATASPELYDSGSFLPSSDRPILHLVFKLPDGGLASLYFLAGKASFLARVADRAETPLKSVVESFDGHSIVAMGEAEPQALEELVEIFRKTPED